MMRNARSVSLIELTRISVRASSSDIIVSCPSYIREPNAVPIRSAAPNAPKAMISSARIVQRGTSKVRTVPVMEGGTSRSVHPPFLFLSDAGGSARSRVLIGVRRGLTPVLEETERCRPDERSGRSGEETGVDMQPLS